MPSFRARVLEALDIQKKSVKLQVNERFPKVYKEDTENENASLQVLQGTTEELTRANAVPYAVSKEIKSTIIGIITAILLVNIMFYFSKKFINQKLNEKQIIKIKSFFEYTLFFWVIYYVLF